MTQQELYAAAAAHADSTLVERLRGDLPETVFEKHNVTDYDAVIAQNHEAADHIERLEAALLLIAIPRVGGGQWASEIAKKVMHIGAED